MKTSALARLPCLRDAAFPDWLALRLLDELSPLRIFFRREFFAFREDDQRTTSE